MRRRAQSTLRWVVSAVVLVGVLGICSYFLLQLTWPVVIVTDATHGPVVQAFYATGTVQPVREYPIKSNLAGILTEVLVDKGDHVRKDQKLAVVSDPQTTFNFNKAKAELEEKLQRADEKSSPVLMELSSRLSANQEMLAIARREEKRNLEMVQRNAATQVDLDRAMDRVRLLSGETESLKAQIQTTKLMLQKDVEVARAALATAQWNLDQQTILSPIDGVVLDRPTSLGTRLAINDHIMQVADVRPENLVLRAAVEEEDKAQVVESQKVLISLYAFPDESLPGKVIRIYPKADPDRRTFEVDVMLEKPDQRLSAGMTGELAFIVSEKKEAMIVPAQALQNGSLWAVRDHRVVKLDAKVGLKSVERIEVDQLQDNEQVIVSPLGNMAPGSLVRTEHKKPQEIMEQTKPKKSSTGFRGMH